MKIYYEWCNYQWCWSWVASNVSISSVSNPQRSPSSSSLFPNTIPTSNPRKTTWVRKILTQNGTIRPSITLMWVLQDIWKDGFTKEIKYTRRPSKHSP